MAPRNISAASVSTTSELSHSMFTESHATESQMLSAGPASIDVMSLDDPAAMSPQAIKAELQYYGVQLKFNSLSKHELEDELVKARHNNSGRKSSQPSQPSNHYQQQYEPSKRGTSPQHHIEATAAKHTGMRNTSSPPNHNTNNDTNDFQTKYPPSTMNGITPTHIPLTPTNRIPPQILNIIRTSADTSMKSINLDHRSLGNSEIIKLSEAMERNKTIQHLSLRNCSISDDAISKLSNMLIKNVTLKELYLDANQITTEGAAALSTALITNETLVVLTLNDNPQVGEKGIVYLIGALEHNKTLRTLDVHHNCGINNTFNNNTNGRERRRSRSRSPGSQSSGGGRSRTINRLDQLNKLLESRQIDSNFESLLERLLDDDYRVTGIDLSGRKIGNGGVSRLADALSDNTQVRQLWLRGCNISNEGALALSSCLEQNMTIVDLFLGNNSIGNEGVIGFADALANSNQTLVSLELDDNNVGVHGFNEFIKSLELNTSVLVASFTNNKELNDVDHHDLLERKLSEKRDSLNLVSFIVDPNAGESYHDSQATSAQDKQGGGGNNSGLVNMSVCSSYMPSTYRRAGFASQGGTGTNPNTNSGPPNDKHLRNSGSYKFSTYNRSNSQDGPTGVPLEGRPPVAPKHNHPPPPPPPPPLYGQQPKQQQQHQGGEGGGKLVRHSSDAVSEASGSQQDYNNGARQGRGGSVKSSSNNSRSRSNNNAYERANVPVPIKAHALDPIQEGNSFGGSMESHCSTLSSTVGTGKHRVKSVTTRNSEAPSKRSTGQSHNLKGNSKNNNNRNSDNNLLVPVVEEEAQQKKNEITPLVQEKKLQVPIMQSTELGYDHETMAAASIKDPQTQRNFNTTLKKLWRRVEMMKRTNHFASVHYKARHFWFWFVPITSSIFMSLVLSLATAIDVSGGSRVGLALFTGFFACVAFCLNFLQSKFGWSSRAEVHRSAEVELDQVAFRLDTLGKYDGRGLSTGSHSTRSRANAVRDLYRIDVYLQAMQRCTPPIPENINEIFYLLASRLKGICLKYPNAVKIRAFYEEEEPDSENPVPLDMQIDALDLLGREIESYFLFPLFIPNARDVVSRTIDIFFAKPEPPPPPPLGEVVDQGSYYTYEQGESEII